jgi:hypothetical protein
MFAVSGILVPVTVTGEIVNMSITFESDLKVTSIEFMVIVSGILVHVLERLKVQLATPPFILNSTD